MENNQIGFAIHNMSNASIIEYGLPTDTPSGNNSTNSETKNIVDTII
jgi:hypothetical protein